MKHPELKRYGLLAVVALLISGMYLLWSEKTFGIGYPLDDAWIHQTFARNLAEKGQWAFIIGKPAAGSTSPLWTLILSIGYLFHIQPLFWTMSLGIIAFISTGILCDLMWRRFQNIPKTRFLPAFGLLIISEWHLVWAALSGMETILYILIVCWIFYLLLEENPRWWLAGLLAGSLVWIRPDGLTMLGPILFLAVWNKQPWKEKIRSCMIVLAFVIALVIAYMVFNYQLDGTIWPNTMYAKQTEYAVLKEESLVMRFFKLYAQVFIGVGVVLIPGLIHKLIQVVKQRNVWGIAAFLWFTGFIAIYAVQLPVTYQHARYLIPTVPICLLLSFSGYVDLCESMVNQKSARILLAKCWLWIVVFIQAGFCLLGAKAFATDVAIIETEMVKTAKWIDANLPQDAIIAVHDIGAMGYFANHELIDLAGLINPEVIPFIRNEDDLLKYIQNSKASYLVTFPDWYPELVSHGEKIFETQSPFSPQAGGENMSIYRVQ